MEYKIVMPYIGGVLSDNSYKFGNKATKPYVRLWMKELETKVVLQGIPITRDKYEIGLFGRFWDERRPDLSNLHKVIGDSIKKGLSVDDKYFLYKDEGYELGVMEQELVITIRISDENGSR